MLSMILWDQIIILALELIWVLVDEWMDEWIIIMAYKFLIYFTCNKKRDNLYFNKMNALCN